VRPEKIKPKASLANRLSKTLVQLYCLLYNKCSNEFPRVNVHAFEKAMSTVVKPQSLCPFKQSIFTLREVFITIGFFIGITPIPVVYF